MNGGIILDARRILAMEALEDLGAYAGREKAWLDDLWQELIQQPALMKEFMYYIDHHTFLDEFRILGYAMTDLYVFQMSRYNLIRDAGKNGPQCNKEFLALGAFADMAAMIKEPEKYEKKLSNGTGMDRL